MHRFFWGLIALVLCVPSLAAAQGVEQITLFRVNATVEANRMLTITEEITYDFGQGERHGIVREIPVRNERNGGSYRLRLDIQAVTMDGEDVRWKIEDQSPLTIRIGDPDNTVSGQHTYAITYQTDRAINFFNGEAELYWNVTGHGWEVPIDLASIAIHGPKKVTSTICFTGAFGSTESSCIESSDAQTGDVAFTSSRVLRAGEGMTIAVRFPGGAVQPPTTFEQIQQFVADNWTVGIPVVTFIVMFWLWSTRGRDPKGKGTIVPQYALPRGLSPAEMAALRNQQVPTSAVTATILDLARRGYLRMEFGEQKGLLNTTQTYTFVKQRNTDLGVSRAEGEILLGLFRAGDRTELKALKGSFYKEINTFKKAVMDRLQEQKMFTAHPERVRGAYLGVAMVMVVVLFWFLMPWMTPVTMGGLVLSALIIGIFGYFMPQKTKEGAIALEEVEGLKWFLSVTEADRLKFHNAPSLKPEQFHQFLPAAIALGVEKAWATQFQGMEIPPPTYATGLNNWSTLYLVSALTDFNHAAASSAYAAPSSAGAGGSGFSGGGVGGGGGGGGGGSW